MLKVWHQLREIIVVRNLKTVKYIIPLDTYDKYGKEVIGKLHDIVIKSDSVEISFEIEEEKRSGGF